MKHIYSRIIALFLCACFIIGFAACTESRIPIADSSDNIKRIAEATNTPTSNVIVGVPITPDPIQEVESTEIPAIIVEPTATPSPTYSTFEYSEEEDDDDESYDEYETIWFSIEYVAEGNTIPNQYRLSDEDSETFKLKTEIPTRNGYKFKNWNTKENGNGKSYNPGSYVNVNRSDGNGEATLVLYAIWETEPTSTPTQTPTQTPTPSPTQEPTQEPTQAPTQEPTLEPTQEPTPSATETPEQETPEPTEIPTHTANTVDKVDNFSLTVAQYLIDNGYMDKSFIVSPTSFRAALCLAISGADGDTKEQLLHAAGFSTQEEANEWYQKLIASTEDFYTYFDKSEEDEESSSDNQDDSGIEHLVDGSSKKPSDGEFVIANAIWNNSSVAEDFLDSYKDYIKTHFDAEAKSSDASSITNDVNSWCEEKTRGLIKRVAADLSQSASVLANAIYIKAPWINSFNKNATTEDDFYCADGTTVKTEFMHDADHYKFYKDDSTKILVINLYGNIQLVCVLGDTTNLMEKINNTEFKRVEVSIPKLDINSSFSNKELVNYLKSLGADLAFEKYRADFSQMCQPGEQWYIDDIVQVAKIKTDEEGLEAAAVTIISMVATAVMDPEIPEEFVADHPFMFYLFSDLGGAKEEILFIGQMADVNND